MISIEDKNRLRKEYLNSIGHFCLCQDNKVLLTKSQLDNLVHYAIIGYISDKFDLIKLPSIINQDNLLQTSDSKLTLNDTSQVTIYPSEITSNDLWPYGTRLGTIDDFIIHLSTVFPSERDSIINCMRNYFHPFQFVHMINNDVLYSLDLSSTIKSYIKSFFYYEIDDFDPTIIHNFEFRFTSNLNQFKIRGKNLSKIKSIYISYSSDIIVDILSKTNDIIKAQVFIDDYIQGEFDIVFISNIKIRRKCKIKMNKSLMKTIKLDEKEYYDLIKDKFTWNQRPNEILFSPSFRDCEYKDYRNANMIDINGATDLIHAVRQNRIDLAEHLLESHCDPNIPTYAREYPIHFASEQGNISMIELLLEYGSFIDVRNKDNETPIDYASKQGHEHVISYFNMTNNNRYNKFNL